jgi:hypothetical protein
MLQAGWVDGLRSWRFWLGGGSGNEGGWCNEDEEEKRTVYENKRGWGICRSKVQDKKEEEKKKKKSRMETMRQRN